MPTRQVMLFTPWRRIPSRQPTWSPSLSLVQPAGSNHRAGACLVDQHPRPFAWLRHRGRVRQGEGSKDHPAPLALLHLVRSTPTAHPFHLQLLSFTRRPGSGVAAAPAAVTRSSLLRPDRLARYLVRGTRMLHTSRAQPGHLQPPAGRSPSRQAPRPAIRASAGRRSTSSTASQPNTGRALSGTDHRHAPVSTASRGLLSPAPGAQRLSHRPEAQSETDRQAGCLARTAECTSTGVTGWLTPRTAHHERSTRRHPRRRAPYQAPAPSRAVISGAAALLDHPNPTVSQHGRRARISVGTRRCRRAAVGNRPPSERRRRHPPQANLKPASPRRQPAPPVSHAPTPGVHPPASRSQQAEHREPQPATGSSARRSTTGTQSETDRAQPASRTDQLLRQPARGHHLQRQPPPEAGGRCAPQKGASPPATSAEPVSTRAGGRFAPRARRRQAISTGTATAALNLSQGLHVHEGASRPAPQPSGHPA